VHTAATFSFITLSLLLLILAASVWVYAHLTRRWTADRPRAALQDWADEKRFRLFFAPRATLPDSLKNLSSLEPNAAVSLVRGPIVILKLTTSTRPTSPRAQWHVLIRQLDLAWSPMGLRPAPATSSFIDLFSLTGFPSLLPPERFVVFANETRDARAMANCSARGLLPADIGLMIHGPFVTLDFSARPFDPIEFNRMLVIMDQLIAHLPANRA
jgi:hypothetical protein